jgi:uncharacterized membrane protein YbhN (UPF0104 family)
MISTQLYPMQTLFQALIFLIITIIFSLFSPFGIGFLVFSIIRAKARSKTIKIISLIIQITLTGLTFLIGLIIAVLFSIRSSGIYTYNHPIITTLIVLLGSLFVLAIEITIIIWESFWIKKKERKVK